MFCIFQYIPPLGSVEDAINTAVLIALLYSRASSSPQLFLAQRRCSTSFGHRMEEEEREEEEEERGDMKLEV